MSSETILNNTTELEEILAMAENLPEASSGKDLREKLKGKTIVMFGDSNGAGKGWYTAEDKDGGDETCDGVFAVLREECGEDVVFKNYAISGAGYLNGSNINILKQIETYNASVDSGAVAKPDIAFFWVGTNDLSNFVGGKAGKFNVREYDINSFDQETVIGKMCYTIQSFRSLYPECKVVGVLRNLTSQKTLYKQYGLRVAYADVYKKYNCQILDMATILPIDEFDNGSMIYFYDDLGSHYNEKAFREVIAPIFRDVLLTGCNVTADPPRHSSFVDDDLTSENWLNQLTPQGIYQYDVARVGVFHTKKVDDVPSKVLMGEVYNAYLDNASTGLTAKTLKVVTNHNPEKGVVEYYHDIGDKIVSGYIPLTRMTYHGCDCEGCTVKSATNCPATNLESIDIRTAPPGDYMAITCQGEKMFVGLPFSAGSFKGFWLTIREGQTGYRAYRLQTINNNKLYFGMWNPSLENGKMRAVSWNRVTFEEV